MTSDDANSRHKISGRSNRQLNTPKPATHTTVPSQPAWKVVATPCNSKLEEAMRKLIVMGLALMCIFFVPFSGMAGDFDGSQPLLCATIKAIECGPEGECLQGTAESVNLPQFFKINF